MTLEDMFTLTALTSAMNLLPVPPSRLGASGLFIEKSVSTTTILVERRQGRLFLVPAASRNDDPAPTKADPRSRRTFEVPHLPTKGQLLPSELQGIAGFGEQSAEAAQATVINDRLAIMKSSLEATREYQRVGAISGQILDADGSVIYDLFDEFGVMPHSLQIALATATTDVRQKLMEAKRYAELKLSGFLITGWKAYASPEFFDALTGHKTVQAAYANWQAAQDRLAGDMRKGFVYGDIEFQEYNAVVSGRRFIAEGKARLVPVVSGLFQMTNAPANYNETVGTLGQPYYAKSEARRMGKGWDLEAQSNPLALCLVPEALVELTI